MADNHIDEETRKELEKEREWWREYYAAQRNRFEPYTPEPENKRFDWLFHLLFTVIPVALAGWVLVSLQQCQSDFKESEKEKRLEQDIRFRTCMDVVKLQRAAENPQAYREERKKEEEKNEEKNEPEIVWSSHNGNYMKCRKDFVKYLKYCQRYIVDSTHDPMYVRAEISGDVLNLISYSFEKLPSNRDRVFSEYEQMILDCKFSEVRMCPLTSIRYYPYWKDGEKYRYSK